MLQGCATLYVQMQLCEETLRHWLDSRNHSSVVPLSESLCLQMFKKIVQGVEYIHSQGIVHHDLKVILNLAFRVFLNFYYIF